MNFLKLTTDRLDLNAINDLVVHESCGAAAFFVGTTRDNFEDKKVTSLGTLTLSNDLIQLTFFSVLGAHTRIRGLRNDGDEITK